MLLPGTRALVIKDLACKSAQVQTPPDGRLSLFTLNSSCSDTRGFLKVPWPQGREDSFQAHTYLGKVLQAGLCMTPAMASTSSLSPFPFSSSFSSLLSLWEVKLPSLRLSSVQYCQITVKSGLSATFCPPTDNTCNVQVRMVTGNGVQIPDHFLTSSPFPMLASAPRYLRTPPLEVESSLAFLSCGLAAS